MAASQTKTDQSALAGFPLYTSGKIYNSAGGTISMGTKPHIWQGSQNADFPETIADQDVGEFTHGAVPGASEYQGSVAGLEYTLADGTKWIIAWSNRLYEPNKVYTEILKQSFKWDDILNILNTRGDASHSTSNLGYTSEANIDSESNTPTLRATIQLSGVTEKEK